MRSPAAKCDVIRIVTKAGQDNPFVMGVADLVVMNDKVLTVDPTFRSVTAVALSSENEKSH